MNSIPFILVVLFVGSLVFAAFRIAFAAGRDALFARRALLAFGVLVEIPALYFAFLSAFLNLSDKASGAFVMAFVGLIFIIAAKLYPTD